MDSLDTFPHGSGMLCQTTSLQESRKDRPNWSWTKAFDPQVIAAFHIPGIISRASQCDGLDHAARWLVIPGHHFLNSRLRQAPHE